MVNLFYAHKLVFTRYCNMFLVVNFIIMNTGRNVGSEVTDDITRSPNP